MGQNMSKLVARTQPGPNMGSPNPTRARKKVARPSPNIYLQKFPSNLFNIPFYLKTKRYNHLAMEALSLKCYTKLYFSYNTCGLELQFTTAKSGKQHTLLNCNLVNFQIPNCFLYYELNFQNKVLSSGKRGNLSGSMYSVCILHYNYKIIDTFKDVPQVSHFFPKDPRPTSCVHFSLKF